MATGNPNRDVKLTIEAQALGGDAIKGLAAQVRALAKNAGEAAPEFERLGNEIEQIGSQAGAVAGLKSLAAEVGALEAKQRNVAEAARAAREAFDQQKSSADTLRGTYNTAAAEVAKLAAEYRTAQLALREYRARATDDEKGTLSYTESVKRQQLAILDMARSLDTAKAAKSGAAQQAREASAAEDDARQTYEASVRTLKQVETALTSRNTALAQSREAAKAAGVAIDALEGEESRLKTTLTNLVAAAEGNRQAMLALAAAQDEAAESARKLAVVQEGIKRIRNEAYSRDLTAKLKAEADAQELLVQAQKEEERVQRRLIEIHKVADAQFREDKLKIEADARKKAADATKQQERALIALQNIQRLAFQSNQAEQIRAQAESMRQLVSGAQAAGRSMEDAFAKVGVRSLNAIEAEIHDTERALSLLERRAASGAISQLDLARATGAAEARMRALNVELRQVPGGTAFERMNTSVLGLVNRFGALSAAAATVGFAVKPVLDATIELERLRRVLGTVPATASQVSKEIEFLRDVAQRSGQSFNELSEGYAKFVASATQAGVPLATVRSVFEATVTAAGNLGLTSDRTGRILEALSQIASKGVVSMEELRQQLGDSLPGALALTAKSLGLTQKQLIDLVESGQLLSEDAIPAIGRAMVELGAGKEIDGIVAEWNRFKNVIMETGTALAEGPLGRAAGGVLQAFAGAARDVSVVVYGFNEALKLTGVTALAVTDVLTGNIKSISEFKGVLGSALDDSAARMTQFRDRAYAGAEGVKGVGDAATVAAVGVREVGGAAAAATPQVAGHAQAMGATATASERVAASMPAANAAVRESGTVAGAASTGWYALQAAYGAVLARVKDQVAASRDLSQAKEYEGRVLTEIAKISGDEAKERAAAAVAAAGNAEALRKEAQEQQNLLDVRRAQIEAMRAQAELEGGLTKQRADAIAALEEEAKKQEALTEKAKQAALASTMAAEAAKVYAESVGDTSGKLEKFKADADRAKMALESVRIEMRAGRAGAADLADAQIKLAGAQRLVADALGDQAKALQQRVRLNELDRDTSAAQAQLNIEVSKTIERRAERTGLLVLQEQQHIKQLQIQYDEETKNIKLATEDIQIGRQAVDLKRQELEAMGALTPEKQRDLELELKRLNVTERQVSVAREKLKQQKEEIDLAKRKALSTPSLNPSEAGAHNADGSGGLGGVSTDRRVLDRSAGNVNGPSLGSTSIGQGIQDRLNTKSGTLGSTYTPPPDNSGDWQWVGDSRVGFRWEMSAAGAANRAAQAKQTLQQAYAVTGTAVPARGILPGGGQPQAVVDWLLQNGFAATGAVGGQATKGQWTGVTAPPEEEATADKVVSLINDALVGVRSGKGRAALDALSEASRVAGNTIGSRTVNITLRGSTTAVRGASEADAANLEYVFLRLQEELNRAGLG